MHDSSDDESYDVFQVSPKQVITDISVIIEGAPVQVCIDSGATEILLTMQLMKESVLLKHCC